MFKFVKLSKSPHFQQIFVDEFEAAQETPQILAICEHIGMEEKFRVFATSFSAYAIICVAQTDGGLRLERITQNSSGT